MEKFRILPLARYKSSQITVNGRNINTCTEGKFLGLKLQTRGTERIDKGKEIISRLRRFDQLTPKLKATLIKSHSCTGVPTHTNLLIVQDTKVKNAKSFK